MENRRHWITCGIVLVALAAILAGFIFVMDIASDSIQQTAANNAEDVSGNVLRQFFAIVVMFFVGLLVLLPFKARLGMTQTLLLSYLAGILTFDAISTVLLSLGIYYSLATVFAVYAALLALLYVITLKRQKSALALKSGEAAKLTFWCLAILAVGYTLSRVPLSILSYDSVQYDLLGKVYAAEHGYVDYVYFQMGGQMLVPSLLGSVAGFFGFSFAYALQNMFTLSGTLLFGYLLFSEARWHGFDRKKAGLVATFGTLLLSTGFFYVFLGITLVPNIFAGLEILLLMVYLYRYSRFNRVIDLALSLAFMLAFCFTRVEGPLVGAFILAYLAHQKLPAKQLGIYTFVTAGVVLLGYISFFAHVGLGYTGDFLSLGKSALSAGLLMVIGVYIFAKDKWFSNKNQMLSRLYLAAVLVFALGLSALDMDKFINNVQVLYLNIFAEGLWITAWFGVILLGVLAIFMTRKDNTFLEGLIPIYLLLTLAIFAFRETQLHINWSDSGNRLMMHIFPLVMFVLADNLMTAFKIKKD